MICSYLISLLNLALCSESFYWFSLRVVRLSFQDLFARRLQNLQKFSKPSKGFHEPSNSSFMKASLRSFAFRLQLEFLFTAAWEGEEVQRRAPP